MVRAAALSVGDVVDGRYRLDAPLGSADVWRATDLQLQRAVALQRVADDEDATRRRLLREARALAQLRHENVVGVYDVLDDVAGAGGPASWLVLELVEGKNLRALLDAQEKAAELDALTAGWFSEALANQAELR